MVALLQSGLGQDAVPDRIYAEKVREQNVTTTQGYTPLGNRSDANRFGEDGSAALVDLAGLVMWKTSNGVVRTIPDSTKARPLFVTDSECVVWMNAFEPNQSDRFPLEVGYYRLDSQTGNMQTTFFALDGTAIAQTPQITDPTFPFGLITFGETQFDGTIGTGDSAENDGNFWYYRLTWDGGLQNLREVFEPELNDLLGEIFDVNPNDDETPQPFDATGFEMVGCGDDGSYVLRFFDDIREQLGLIWVDSEGNFELLDEPDAYRSIRTTNTDIVLAPAYPTTGSHLHFTRTPDSKGPPVRATITRPAGRSTIPMLYWGPLGKATYIYEFASPNLITQSRLVEGAYVDEVTFTLPAATVALDAPSAAVVAINSSEGNLVDQDESLPATAVIRGLRTTGVSPRSCFLWLHQGTPGFNFDPSPFSAVSLSTSADAIANELKVQQANPSTFAPSAPSGGDFSFVGHSVTANPTGYPLLVSRNQLVYSEDSFKSNTDSGARPPVKLRHYNNTASGVTVRYGNVTYTGIRRAPIVNLLPFTSESAEPSPIPGNHVVIPAAHNTEPRNWRFSTYLKRATSNNSFDIFDFKLGDSSIADIDSDGIVSALEDSPYYIVPGNFTYDQALADAPLHGGVLADLTTVPADLLIAARAVRYQLDREASRFGSRIHLPSTGLWLAGVEQAGPPRALLPRHLAPDLTVGTSGSVSTLRGGYLLKLPATDRYEPDADGDNLVDGAEVHKTFTSPTAANFTSVPSEPRYDPSTDGLGHYAGVIHGPLGQELAGLELSVAKAGKYTGRLLGPLGAVSFRGVLGEEDAIGYIRLTYGASMVDGEFQLIRVGSSWGIEGQFVGLNASQGTPGYWPRQSRPASFKLVKKLTSTTEAGIYTVTLPSTGFIGTPAGDGYASINLAWNGSAKLTGRLANNVPVSWKGSLLEDGRFAVAAFGSRMAGTSAVGNLFLRTNAKFNLRTPTREESDVDGVIAAATKTNSTAAGYDVFVSAYGSVLSPVGFAQMPAFTEYATTSNNVRLDFQAGSMPSRAFIATWDTKGKIYAPLTQTLGALKMQFDRRSGLVSGRVSYNDPGRGYANTRAESYAVMLQKSGEIRGFYATGPQFGKFEITPNYGGNPAPITSIAPGSRGLGAEGGAFDVTVVSSEPWEVVVPADARAWVTVDTIFGYGDGRIAVSVLPNFSALDRTAVLKIAGKSLSITQSRNRTVAGVVISPARQVWPGAGGNYPVYVSSPGGFSSDLVNGQSFDNRGYDWVTVTPVVVGGVVTSTTVTLERNAGGFPRTAQVVIAGRLHEIVQGPI